MAVQVLHYRRTFNMPAGLPGPRNARRLVWFARFPGAKSRNRFRSSTSPSRRLEPSFSSRRLPQPETLADNKRLRRRDTPVLFSSR